MLDRREKYDTPIYSGVKDGLKQTYKLQGVKGLYQGLGLSCLQNVLTLIGGKKIYDFIGN